MGCLSFPRAKGCGEKGGNALKNKTKHEKIINNTTTKHNKCYLSILFVLCRATGMLEPISDISGDRQGNTLDRWLVHHRVNAQTD